MFIFFSSRKTVLKSWLDTSSIASYLSSFLSQSRQLLDTWWIDRECSYLLDSFSTPSGSIKLLFLDLIPCCSIPQLSTTIFSIPTSIDSLIPLNTCICRDLLRVYIFSLRDPFLISLISLDLSAPVHLPNTLFFIPNLFLEIFQAFFKFFFSLGKFLISHSSCIS